MPKASKKPIMSVAEKLFAWKADFLGLRLTVSHLSQLDNGVIDVLCALRAKSIAPSSSTPLRLKAAR